MKSREEFKNSIYEKRDRYYAGKSIKRKKAMEFFAPITVCLVLCCAVLALPLLNTLIPTYLTELSSSNSYSSENIDSGNTITSETSNSQIDTNSEVSSMLIDNSDASSKNSSNSISQTDSNSKTSDMPESQITESSEPGLSRGWFDNIPRIKSDSSSQDNGNNGTVTPCQLYIRSVEITTLPESEEYKKTYRSEDKINIIINYLGNLELSQLSTDPDQYSGMRYIITFNYSDKTKITFVHFGNKFLKINNDEWKEMNYDQAIEFEQILNRLESD